MFFILSKFLEFLLLPLTWILILSVAGFMNRPYSARCRIAAFILLLIFTNPFFLNQAMRAWEVPGRKITSIDKPYDVVIVLGGSIRYFNGELQRPVYSTAADRLLQAIALYKQGKAEKILLTGGSGRVLYPEERESAILNEVLKEAAIPPDDIILENESRNTYQNAIESAKILRNGKYGDRFLILTSSYHMRRTMACFLKAGIKGEPWPVDQRSGSGTFSPDRYIVPDAGVLEAWDILFHEWFGILVYKAAGYC